VVRAYDAEVPGAALAGTLCHRPQPVGLILLGDALGHGIQVFGVDPATTVALGVQYKAILIVTDASGIYRF
jgi:hypothetical protein